MYMYIMHIYINIYITILNKKNETNDSNKSKD